MTRNIEFTHRVTQTIPDRTFRNYDTLDPSSSQLLLRKTLPQYKTANKSTAGVKLLQSISPKDIH